MTTFQMKMLKELVVQTTPPVVQLKVKEQTTTNLNVV
jgi:hypothetical protein